jgi:hypothetical protein
MFIKYYYLSLLFITFLIQSFGYIHLIERTIASFEEKPIHAKSCQNCKYFIENENIDLMFKNIEKNENDLQ